VELNPEPVNVNTVFLVPDVGVTTILAVTLNIARKYAGGTPTDMSFTGVPLT
jgi:hypothetical protein